MGEKERKERKGEPTIKTDFLHFRALRLHIDLDQLNFNVQSNSGARFPA